MVGVLSALLALCVVAAPAQATRYQFTGDKGTSCTVDVTANASTTIGVLSGTPRVGFGSNPVCHYAASAAPGPAGGTAAATARKACKASKKKGKRAYRSCVKKKRKLGTRAVPTVVNVPALLDLAKLDLLTPFGVKVPGAETLASLGLGGYTCLLGIGANCSDIGQLEPAIPYLGYSSEFSIRLAPPPGEHWASAPAGCSGAPAVSCVLTSPTVVPTL
ncbi:MAG: hypothetical protein QOD60_1344 [Solirubrobacterales bacterium]|jgi:hypothetical protein|nr:hypothetical protein [Solirubrobacterales bacterium]